MKSRSAQQLLWLKLDNALAAFQSQLLQFSYIIFGEEQMKDTASTAPTFLAVFNKHMQQRELLCLKHIHVLERKYSSVYLLYTLYCQILINSQPQVKKIR